MNASLGIQRGPGALGSRAQTVSVDIQWIVGMN